MPPSQHKQTLVRKNVEDLRQYMKQRRGEEEAEDRPGDWEEEEEEIPGGRKESKILFAALNGRDLQSNS